MAVEPFGNCFGLQLILVCLNQKKLLSITHPSPPTLWSIFQALRQLLIQLYNRLTNVMLWRSFLDFIFKNNLHGSLLYNGKLCTYYYRSYSMDDVIVYHHYKIQRCHTDIGVPIQILADYALVTCTEVKLWFLQYQLSITIHMNDCKHSI